MSERSKPHNGRDSAGNLRVRTADVEDLETDPAGGDFIRDDVRLGGAVADVGAHAGERGEQISKLVAENRDNVKRVTKRKRA
jgi:hypothetical protein